jgi:hypothetical protein
VGLLLQPLLFIAIRKGVLGTERNGDTAEGGKDGFIGVETAEDCVDAPEDDAREIGEKSPRFAAACTVPGDV